MTAAPSLPLPVRRRLPRLRLALHPGWFIPAFLLPSVWLWWRLLRLMADLVAWGTAP